MKIRKISLNEVNVIQDLAHRVWPHTFKEILSLEQIEYMLNMMYHEEVLGHQINEGHEFYIAEEEGIPIGFVGVQINHPETGTLKIHKIYILPEIQGKGVGRLLMDQAVDIAQQHGFNSILLNVNRFNKAVDFYTHYGFDILCEENIDIGNGYLMEDFVMKLNLVSED